MQGDAIGETADLCRGRLLVVSGPSGVGKSSVVDGLAQRVPFHFSVSLTTRPARPGEVDGTDYHFVTRDEFERRIQDEDLLEWAEYNGNLYGTPKADLLGRLRAGEHVVLDIENHGAAQVKANHPEATLVFLAPPSLGELRRRLLSRGNTDGTDRRLAIAASQLEEARDLFDHIVVNDDLDAAIDEVVDILTAPQA